MKIFVKSYNELKSLTADLPAGGQMEAASGDTVRAILARLKISSQKMSGLVLFVNGRAARLETELKAGDNLVFFSPLAGG